MAAPARTSELRALVADRVLAVAVPLSRRERRALHRMSRRAVARRNLRGLAQVVASRTTAPVARGAVVALTAGLLVGGDLGTAEAVGYGGVAGTIGRAPAERAVSAQVARLAGQAEAAARGSRAESLAVATAALDAATAVAPLTGELSDQAVRAELAEAVERLTGLVTATRPEPWRMRADVPVPAAQPAPSVRGADGAVLTRALADTAGTVFRLSMQVETLSGAIAQDETVARVGSLAELEAAVASADEALAGLEELEPLTPLTEEERLALEAELAADGDAGAVPVRAGARVRLATPAAVAELMADYQNGRIPAEALCAVPFAPDHRLQCDAAAALAELNEAYREEFGTNLAVVSSYRPYDVQVSLRASKGGLAAVPGTSNHGWGIAVDLGGIGGLGQFTKPGYLWLQEHAGAYGWVHPAVMEPGGGGPQEPWHWEFGTS